MSRGFIAGNKDQIYFLPPSVDDWVKKDHLVRFIWDCLGLVDLSFIYDAYATEGKPPFEPKHMLGILIYAYSKGMKSSRLIAKACEDDIAFRWIAGNLKPKHSAICRFRRKHIESFTHIFLEVLRLCADAGAINIDKLFVDGTKIKASAALEANKTLDRIKQEIESILEQAEQVDREEDALFGKAGREDELPPELADPRKRLARLMEAKKRLEKVAEAEAAKQNAPSDAAGSKRAEKIRDSDDSPPPPEPPKLTGNKAKANITDPDSRIVKTRKGFIQGYNSQIMVTEEQFIVAAEVSQNGNDVNLLEPMLESALANLEAVGIEKTPKALAADAGYWKEDLPVEKIEKNGPELFVATKKDWKQRKESRERGAPRGRLPNDLSRREKMERKLLTKRGFGVYRLRGGAAEAPFGHIKGPLGAERFNLRGLVSVNGEWVLTCAVHNLKKLFFSGRALPV
jgi:transposase